jgi:HK97 family phage prohead protease
MSHDAPIHFLAYAPALTLSKEARTISGTITVFDTPTNDYRRLVLHEGALRPRLPLSKVKMLRDHDPRQPVGFMVSLSADTSTATFKIPEGADGDLALEQASNGLRDGLSVGIQVLNEDGAFTYDSEHGTYHVYAAELVEVSLCAIPAYSDAQVSEVNASRAALSLPPITPPKEVALMPETDTLTLTRADLTAELDAAMAAATAEQDRNLEARLATFAGSQAPSGPQFSSYGDFVKAFSAGMQEAKDFALAYAGATTTDDFSRNTWLADAIRLVEKTRKVINTFTSEPLPEKGMTLEYAKLKSNTMKVGKQAQQGDDLLVGKIELTTATTDIGTYGGYTELSRQVIDRANSAYVTTAFKAMLIEYARATEAAVRAVLDALITSQTETGTTVNLSATASAYDWLDALIDAAEIYEDKGYDLAGTFVSKDVFKRLVRLEDTAGNSLMRVFGEGVNQTGEISVTKRDGTLAGVNFRLLAGAGPNTAAFYDPLALTVWEDSSPTQLEDTNAKNLTNGYSVYGYLAAASQFPDALVPLTFGAAPAVIG